MLQPEQLYFTLQQQPFQPVRVHLTDGRTIDIRSRELAVVGVNYLAIGIQATDEPEGIIATSIKVPLSDIRLVEPLPSPVSPAAK